MQSSIDDRALGGFVYWVFRDGFPNHAENVLQKLKQDLQTLEAYYNEPIATGVIHIPAPTGVLADFCWPEVEPFMKQHNGQYALELVGVYGYWGTPDSRPIGSTDTVVDIVFPDGTRMRLHYYNGFLENGQLLDENE